MSVARGFRRNNMLVARREDEVAVEAWGAEKGNRFYCLGCKESVILKKGHIVMRLIRWFHAG